MKKSIISQPWGFYQLSFLLALLLGVIPWNETIALFQPYWLALIVAYWSLQSERDVMLTAFSYGLMQDVLSGSLLGKHGISLIAISFLISKSAKKLNMTSFGQLLLMVVAVLFNDLFIRSVIDWSSYRYLPKWTELLPIISAILVWPWLKYLLDRISWQIKNKH